MSGASDNGERLARVEQDVITVKDYLLRIDSKLDAWTSIYVPRQEISEMFRSRDKEIQELKDSKRSNRALYASWAAVAVAALAIIIQIWPNK